MKTKETGRYLKQLTGFNVLFARRKQLKILSVLLTGNGTTLACAGYLIFEQDLTSFYETGKLNLAVDCRGDGIQLPHHQVVCYVAKISSRCVQQDQTGLHDDKKIPVTNPQHQTNTVKNASVCTKKKQTLK